MHHYANKYSSIWQYVYSTSYAQTFDTRVWKGSEEDNHLSCSIWQRFFVWPGSDPKSNAIYLSPIPSFFLWVKKTGQEFLALEVCLVTQRTREGPCVAFNSLHCQPKANLGWAQSLTAHGRWMDEWKVKYAFKCKTEVWPGIVVVSLWECEICRWPRQQEERGQFQFEKLHSGSCLQVVGFNSQGVHHFSCSPMCEKINWCNLHQDAVVVYTQPSNIVGYASNKSTYF